MATVLSLCIGLVIIWKYLVCTSNVNHKDNLLSCIFKLYPIFWPDCFAKFIISVETGKLGAKLFLIIFFKHCPELVFYTPPSQVTSTNCAKIYSEIILLFCPFLSMTIIQIIHNHRQVITHTEQVYIVDILTVKGQVQM